MGSSILKTDNRKRLRDYISWSSNLIEEHFGNGGQEIRDPACSHGGLATL